MMGIHVNMIYVSGEVDSDTAHNIAGLEYVDKRICPRSETRRSGNMTIFTLGCLRESGKLSIAVQITDESLPLSTGAATLPPP